MDPKKWPMFIETDDAVNKKKVTIYKPPTPEMIAYLDFSVNSNGLLTGVKVCLLCQLIAALVKSYLLNPVLYQIF